MADAGSFSIDDEPAVVGGPDAATGDTGYVDPSSLAGGTDTGAADDRTFDADRHIGRDRLNADGTYRRKRARRGSGGGSPRAASKAVPPSVGAIEGILYSIHAMLAVGLQAPELALSEPEAHTLAKAVAEVQAHYPNSIFSPAVAAWVSLGMVAGSVYIPRVINIRARLASAPKVAPPSDGGRMNFDLRSIT